MTNYGQFLSFYAIVDREAARIGRMCPAVWDAELYGYHLSGPIHGGTGDRKCECSNVRDCCQRPKSVTGTLSSSIRNLRPTIRPQTPEAGWNDIRNNGFEFRTQLRTASDLHTIPAFFRIVHSEMIITTNARAIFQEFQIVLRCNDSTFTCRPGGKFLSRSLAVPSV